MLTYVNSSVWQRRTNKIIAGAVIFIGLTMLISTIPQCIYAGLVFIVLALAWLAWMRMKESKEEPPRPPPGMGSTTSPVLFLVASQNLTSQRPRGPTLADPNDKPPTYDQIIKLDGLPPDYITVLAEKPPRYEDLEIVCSGLKLSRTSSGIPVELYHPTVAQVHSFGNREGSANHSGSSGNLSSSAIDRDLGTFSAISDATGLHFYDTSSATQERGKDAQRAEGEGELTQSKVEESSQQLQERNSGESQSSTKEEE